MSHLNVGRLQLIYLPRTVPFFWRRRTPIYSFVLYLWPIEFRLFAREAQK